MATYFDAAYGLLRLTEFLSNKENPDDQYNEIAPGLFADLPPSSAFLSLWYSYSVLTYILLMQQRQLLPISR